VSIFRGPHSTIATPPLAALVLGLVLAAAPLFGRVAGWAFALFCAAGAARLLMNRPGARLPSLAGKVLLFGIGFGGILLTYGAFVGIEPGLSGLLLLVSLKLLETNTVRDFQVIALLGFFMALCALFFAQNLALWLYVLTVFVLLTAALVHFHRGPGARRPGRSLRLGAALLLQALPIVALLFAFFPRGSQQSVVFMQPAATGGGMSDQLSPGSVASLALGSEVVFRAEFPDGNAPSMSAMYWRGGVLWQGNGLNWQRGRSLSVEDSALRGATIRQRIILEPHGGLGLFALDRPATEIRGAFLDAGGFLQTQRPVLKQVPYEVISRPDNRETELPPDHLRETLRQPQVISPQIRALVAGWRSAHSQDRDLADAALRYFRSERFTYSLAPGTYNGPGALDEFLFRRRTGFCEHYAAAFATLMRVAGIPSRVVLGYHGGEFNARGRYVIVRQSDAHAWCEVWIKGEGWLRLDPTDVIAPDRLSSGLTSYLENRAASTAGNTSSAAAGWREVRRDLRLVWDNLSYQWDLHVLSFDGDGQKTFLATIGLGDFRWVEMTLTQIVGAAVLLGALGLWQRRPRRAPADAVSRAYARFCAALATAGVPREPWEGPLQFGERAAAHCAPHATAIREIATLYARLRYGAAPPSPAAFLRAVRALPRLRP
jgi:protein-glutamine gamma-glutamyltransferase